MTDLFRTSPSDPNFATLNFLNALEKMPIMIEKYNTEIDKSYSLDTEGYDLMVAI